jgi:hypothetical protein
MLQFSTELLEEKFNNYQNNEKAASGKHYLPQVTCNRMAFLTQNFSPAARLLFSLGE